MLNPGTQISCFWAPEVRNGIYIYIYIVPRLGSYNLVAMWMVYVGLMLGHLMGYVGPHPTHFFKCFFWLFLAPQRLYGYFVLRKVAE